MKKGYAHGVPVTIVEERKHTVFVRYADGRVKELPNRYIIIKPHVEFTDTEDRLAWDNTEQRVAGRDVAGGLGQPADADSSDL